MPSSRAPLTGPGDPPVGALPPAWSLIGPGRLGLGLALALVRRGHPPLAVHGRSERSRRRSRRTLPGVGTTRDATKAVQGAALVVLAVPDDALEGVATALTPHAAGRLWIHLSGCHGPEILEPLATAGGRVAAIHPLQTVPAPEQAPDRLAGIPFTVVAGEAEWPQARDLVRRVGGMPVRVPGAGRPLYHAAAVLACNDLVALLGVAFRLLTEATGGVLEGRALLPLVRATLDGVAERGPREALTGPVVRGDTGVVVRHLAALTEQAPWALPAYRALGLETVELARQGGGDREALNAIERILTALPDR